MRIGELAEKTGVSRDTIRFYERNGLISSSVSDSTTNNYREYKDDCVVILKFYAGAREAGMSIADLRSIMESTADSCDPEVGRRVIQSKISELKERAGQIENVIRFLEKVKNGAN
ncbi:MerR family transcriptional regulator [Neptunicoccus cionae]|uniref:MerR family transcriptional regulator n=1 Tax=Neptunicoccus cionae TaxID=2035344 RepID=UPI000C7595D8|nr:MerR family transcriptional regulator [Amylibacter cionae]PLS23398.1 MerR family transcriptional regulator [Amylibacter cionae]